MGKQFRVEFKSEHGWLTPDAWSTWEFVMLTEAVEAAKERSKRHQGNLYRIVDTLTKEIVAEFRGGPGVVVEPAKTTGDLKVSKAAAKAPLGMIPLRALTGTARVFQYGGKKYAPGNFLLASKDDGALDRYASALLRHLEGMQDPNGLFTAATVAEVDEESGLPHIDHAICSLIMLRSIAMKDGLLKVDPGQGKEPPK